jgi:hypothetical protein
MKRLLPLTSVTTTVLGCRSRQRRRLFLSKPWFRGRARPRNDNRLHLVNP